MKKVFVIVLYLLKFFTNYGQDSTQNDPTWELKKIDSIMESINKSILNEKRIIGIVKPFSDIRGIAFLNAEHTEIKKLEFRVLSTNELITYFCAKNRIQVILTSQSLYYRNGNNYFAFHSLVNKRLFTELELQQQDDFFKMIKKNILEK